MFLDFISDFNWVDLVLVVFVLRFCYAGLIFGVGFQLLPTLWIFSTFSLIVLFYQDIAFFLQDYLRFSFNGSILTSVILIFILCYAVKKIFDKLLKVDAPEGLILIEKYAGLIIGFLRGMLGAGLICIFIASLPIKEVDRTVPNSVLGSKILMFDVRVVMEIFKYVPALKERTEVSETMNTFLREKPDTMSLVDKFHLKPPHRRDALTLQV